jgi:FkbM family methyltransferase
MNKEMGDKLRRLAGVFHLKAFCRKVGLTYFIYRRCNKEELRASREFFSENQERIAKNLDLFLEEESKKTYKKAILYRQSGYMHHLPRLCKEEEYFNSLTPINQEEIFIDGGYTGDSVLEFIALTKGKYKGIVSFEPDPINLEAEKENLKGCKDCVILPYGLWKERTQLCFEENKGQGSKIDEAQSEGFTVEVAAIDELSECEGATFIKMDIEGSELMALEGAKQTILRNRPILTICIYHTDKDMLDIPEWMANNLSDYSYYVRHHSWHWCDTVLYCIPKERTGE